MIRLVHTFTLVENLINTVDLEEDAQNLLSQNMDGFYKTSFRPVFLSLAFLIRANTNSYSKELIDFVTAQEKKCLPNFDIYSFEK